MTDLIKEKTCKININTNRVFVGLLSFIVGIIGILVRKNKPTIKYSKLVGMFSVLSAVFGSVLLVTELEENFKPIDEEDDMVDEI